MSSENDTFPDPNTLLRGDVRISWVDNGEGQDGIYNPSNPDDMPLLRFQIFYLGGGEEVMVASVKSQTSRREETDIRQKLLQKIADQVVGPIEEKQPTPEDSEVPAIKTTLEKLAWIGPEWAFDW